MKDEDIEGVIRYTYGTGADNKLYATYKTFEHYYIVGNTKAHKMINSYIDIKTIPNVVNNGTNRRVILTLGLPLQIFLSDYAAYRIGIDNMVNDMDAESEREVMVLNLSDSYDKRRLTVKELLEKLVDEKLNFERLSYQFDQLRDSIAVYRTDSLLDDEPNYLKGSAYDDYVSWLQNHAKTEPNDNHLKK